MVQVDMNNTLLSAFDKTGQFFAIITNDQRLKLWNTATGTLHSEYICHDNLVKQYTHIQFGNIKEDNPKKKKNKGANEHEKGIKVIALGTNQGEIIIYGIAQGTVIQTLKNGHIQSINSFVFANEGKTAYSASEDQLIIEWDLISGKKKHQISSDKGTIKSMAISNDGEYLISAGRTIHIWNIRTKTIVNDLAGHATNVEQLLMTTDQNFFLSMAGQDRFINLWKNAAQVTAGDNLIGVLSTESNPIRLDIITIKESLFALAVSEDGLIYVWEDLIGKLALGHVQKKDKKKGKGTMKPHSVINFVEVNQAEMEEDSQSMKKIPILAAKFLKKEGDNIVQLLTVRGNSIKPFFEKIDIIDEKSGKMKEVVTLKRQIDKNMLFDSNVNEKLKQTKKNYVEENVKILGSGDQQLPAPFIAIDEDNKLMIAEEITLEEKLKDLDMEEKQQAIGDGTPKANSLQRMLTQALHSNDNQLLEQCLAIHDPIVIQNTIKKLPSAYVMPFLTQIVHKFQLRPNRGILLAVWIRAIFTFHTAYLMALPSLVKDLSGLYQTVDSRLSTFKRLLRLNGRLDLVMSQVMMRNQIEEDDYDGQQALTTYNDDEDESHENDMSDEDLLQFANEDTLLDAETMVEEEDEVYEEESSSEVEESFEPDSNDSDLE